MVWKCTHKWLSQVSPWKIHIYFHYPYPTAACPLIYALIFCSQIFISALSHYCFSCVAYKGNVPFLYFQKHLITWLYLLHLRRFIYSYLLFQVVLYQTCSSGRSQFNCMFDITAICATAAYCTEASYHVLCVLSGTVFWMYIYPSCPLCLHQPVFLPIPSKPVSFRGHHMLEGSLKKKKILWDYLCFLICAGFDRIALCCKFSACEASVIGEQYVFNAALKNSFNSHCTQNSRVCLKL